MKKNSIAKKSPKRVSVAKPGPITIGMDLGDKTSRYCVLGADGEIVAEGTVGTNKKAMTQKFSGMKRCRIAIEVGPHSPWLSRLLTKLGYEVIVANARQVQLISASSRKNDRMDAQMLARVARVDPALLRPIRHRSEQAQGDLMAIRVRAALVEQVESLTGQIQKLDTELKQIARSKYPETELLQQVSGVGTLIALTFVLTVEDRERFQKSNHSREGEG